MSEKTLFSNKNLVEIKFFCAVLQVFMFEFFNDFRVLALRCLIFAIKTADSASKYSFSVTQLSKSAI